jgi:hypothetical protein
MQFDQAAELLQVKRSGCGKLLQSDKRHLLLRRLGEPAGRSSRLLGKRQ